MKLNSLLIGGAAALTFGLGCSHAVVAQNVTSAGQTASATATVFTVRYVCLVATPKIAPTPQEERASLQQLPAIFDEMQHGSPRAMSSTPSAFLHSLTTAQPDYSFKILLSGSTRCVLGDQQAATINDSSDISTYHTTLTESIFLTRNSPTRLTLHHTGQIAYTTDLSSRGGPGWLDMHTDKIVIGRVYTQGVENIMDGRKVTYAFCILPGDLDQMASAWNAHKTDKMKKTASVLSGSEGGKR